MSDEPESAIPPGDEERELEELLDFLRDRRGFDFTGYKRPSLTRRIRKRMQEVSVSSFDAYRSVLETVPQEFDELFNTILINVTRFFRDREAWEFLEHTIIPDVVRRAEDGGPIRVWSAGSATGEEAYSLAVLLAAAVGDDRFREAVKIYATDVDNDALDQARHPRFPYGTLVEAFGEDRAGRYFEPRDGSYTFRRDLRRSLIFGRHDLVQDAPISRIDLIVCRNTLMYFNAEMQRRILANFHFALNQGGYLFLGKSEVLVVRTHLFTTVDLRHHVFAKQGRSAVRPPVPMTATSRPDVGRRPEGHLAQSAFEASATAQIVIDAAGMLSLANRQARILFGIGLHQLGRPFRDLELSYRPVDLRTPLDHLRTDRRPITLPTVEHRGLGDEVRSLDVVVQPVERDGAVIAAVVAFQDVSVFRQVSDELERSQRDLELAYEELQSAMEELETTNEELQSTNEELETTNEELHSTNEELETMNEELQSSNEELETLNGELRERTEELNATTSFLQSVLAGLQAGVVVLGSDLTIRTWNRRAEDLWGLRADEVETQHFFGLDSGLPVDALRAPIRRCLSGEADLERLTVPAVTRRGRTVDCGVTITPLRAEGQVTGVVLVMEAEDARTEPT